MRCAGATAFASAFASPVPLLRCVPQLHQTAKLSLMRFDGRIAARSNGPDCGVQTILLHIIARGKIARSPEGELVDRYAKRMTWPVKLTELPDTGGKVPEPQTPLKTVLLDERGKALSSEALAETLEHWRDTGTRETRFVLGAADGHSNEDRANADLLLAFGPATWPHLLARAMLMEQLYRATSILAGHPYHRAG